MGDTTRLDNQCLRGRKVAGFGFDPAHPTLDPLVAKNDGFVQGRKIDGFGFDPKKPSPDMPQRNRCKKVGDFGFDPAHPTPSPAVFNMIGGQRCKKFDGFGFDPAHPTPSPQAKPLERSHTDGSKDWEA